MSDRIAIALPLPAPIIAATPLRTEPIVSTDVVDAGRLSAA